MTRTALTVRIEDDELDTLREQYARAFAAQMKSAPKLQPRERLTWNEWLIQRLAGGVNR